MWRLKLPTVSKPWGLKFAWTTWKVQNACHKYVYSLSKLLSLGHYFCIKNLDLVPPGGMSGETGAFKPAEQQQLLRIKS